MRSVQPIPPVSSEAANSAPGAARLIRGLIFGAFLLYAARLIYLSSFVIEEVRYFVLFDDAMISMRFARNLASGYGLVWNPGGERIEGYTNLLWTLYMAGAHLLPVSLEKVSLVIQVTCALCLLGNLWTAGRLSRAVFPAYPVAELSTLLFVAFFYPLNKWSMTGMEVGPLAWIVTGSMLLAVRGLTEQRFSPWPYVLLGVGILVRLDVTVVFLAMWMVLLIQMREFRLRTVVWGLAMLILALGSQTLFRWMYYGDLLPNTYYLKMTGFPPVYRIAHGAMVFARFATEMLWFPLLIPAFAALWWRDSRVALLLAVFWAQCSYSVYVGGDAWDKAGGTNRFITIVMPLAFVLWTGTMARWMAQPGQQRGRQVLGTLILALTFGTSNRVHIHDAPLDWLLWYRPQHTDGNQPSVQAALDLKAFTEPKAKIAVIWAGALPYFADRECIDVLGKCDRKIAHMPMRTDPTRSLAEQFYPGHMKWDYSWSIGELKPDVAINYWALTPEERAANFTPYYDEYKIHSLSFYVRKGSPNIRWDVLKEIADKPRRRAVRQMPEG
ncbi:MAG: hypothetical protein K1X53_12800 [Candidatus Sumerlaeaceae bacterium]|nr:hypothetical protein [Candidatus Sumerlaeaceae bacterium]